MRGQHCDPAEAVQIHLALGAHRSVGMHWGAFPFTDEPREEPPARLSAAAAAAGLGSEEFVPALPGETAHVPPSPSVAPG
jgi:N-acyl-phosphatidylethanolamine-hydrolysing phospholipase D